MQVTTRRTGGEEKDAEARRHGRRRQPVVARHAARPDDGHVGEHEEQLGGEDGLDQGEVAVVQRGDLEDEAQDHAGDAGHPDGLAHEVEQQPWAQALTTGRAGGPEALAHRRGRRAEARGERQHHRLHHEPILEPLTFPCRYPPPSMLFARGGDAGRTFGFSRGRPSPSRSPQSEPGPDAAGRCLGSDQAPSRPDEQLTEIPGGPAVGDRAPTRRARMPRLVQRPGLAPPARTSSSLSLLRPIAAWSTGASAGS